MAMSAKEITKARRSTWRREFAMLVKMAEKMKYEQKLKKAKELVMHVSVGDRRENKSQKTEEGAGLARSRKSNHSCS